ncbi:uncharacterized protein LOC116245538 [Nymphaea colorata]|uniref:uncharacterized protein LOC116245538 n=1 Tax=Nymphaea colorata TaxID=210225 RepID=UPI00129E1F1D|nr:uncharacterized protein LOC116245538 [Nymphaea colorata]
MTGLVTSNGTQCACITSFIWINSTCACPGPQFIVLNRTCFNCNVTTFNFSGKGVAAGLNQCSCRDPSFIWSDSLRKCICGANTIFTNNTCMSCTRYAKTIVSNDSNCVCIANYTFDVKTLSCICSANNSIIRKQTCVDCSSTTINGLLRTNTITCSCNATLNLVWDNTTQTCVCKSNTFANGKGCTSCANITYSTGVGVQGVSCVCKNTFTWLATSLTCGCNSSTVLGPVTTAAQTCINCNALIGASGVSSKDSTQCTCLGKLTWDSLKKMCVCADSSSIITPDGSCYVCSNTTDPNIVNPPVDAYNCKCANPFFWDNLRLKCIKCTDLANGLSKKSGTELSCPCKTGYYFDPYTNLCLLTPKNACVAANITNCLNCTIIPYADIITGPVAQTAGKFQAAKDTSVITKQYSALIKTYNSYQCLCSGAYLWEPTRRRCQSIF